MDMQSPQDQQQMPNKIQVAINFKEYVPTVRAVVTSLPGLLGTVCFVVAITFYVITCILFLLGFPVVFVLPVLGSILLGGILCEGGLAGVFFASAVQLWLSAYHQIVNHNQ